MGKHNPYSAAGPHYGHMVQESLMFKYLLEADDDDIVSLEYHDDIAVEKPDGDILAVQSKSAMSWNPVSNRSPDLWKTISNWIVMSQQGLLAPERTKFIIALAKGKRGSLSTKFMEATTDDDFSNALKAVKEEFKDGVPKGIASYISTFEKADHNILKHIILNFLIETYDDPRKEVLSALKKRVEERSVAPIFDMMTGWLKNKIESLIIDSKPPFIEGKEFRAQLFASLRELSQLQFLHDYAQEPSTEEAGEHFTRTYVKQLELILCDTEEKMDAISSYIKSKTNMIRWADDGLVHGNSFDEFYSSIQNKWNNEKRKASVLHKNSKPEDRGKIILYECNNFKEHLSGLHVPSHFTKGCFHDCADKLKIGWHEEYLKLLSGDNDE
ncbi:ABC-three component system protein [Oceanidesulfovibrio marinus]|uniref:ABC-three component system protein n=1 Tax=Oceanidesulfovibrio marinus TaxID=370038 RepID=UPI00118335AE|nr:ABC-three component system protein [Oceanidesulfovibrio marinus]